MRFLFVKHPIDNAVEYKKAWHNWFAWYPVRLDGQYVAWLEVVERKGTHRTYATCDGPVDFWDWKYRGA